MEVANEIMKGVVQVLMVPVKRQLDYLISYGKHVEDMHTKMKILVATRDKEEEHLKQNREGHLEVPSQVSPWLSEVEDVNAEVEKFPQEVLGCFDLKSRHKLGRKASKIIKEIDRLTTEQLHIRWTDLKIPTGRIDSGRPSTSTPLITDGNDFPSRVQTYEEALKALGPDHKPHMVALWGMGGVGKTFMMEKLRQAVVEKKMFSYYAQGVIGQDPDIKVIQNSIASYLNIKLDDQVDKQLRVDQLRQGFNDKLAGGKKFLVILDDVWKPFDLKDIGLSLSANQGVNFKVLLTSRNRAAFTEMGVKDDSILSVGLLTEAEAQSLFRQHWEPSDDVDTEVHEIAKNIARKCCCLPIAIKTMARTLRSKKKDAWKTALSRLEHHDIKTVAGAVFETSYDNLEDEKTESIFMLCGLFPEDFNIPTEELLWYAWGLNLFKGVGTIREARYRLNDCIERLLDTNLLIESDYVRYVKMHDLVRSFVLKKGEHALIVNHGNNPEWPEDDMSASSFKRISLTCSGMREFPSELKFPNLSVLKLMHGDVSLKFRQNFYREIEKLQVISFDEMEYPLLPSSLECSTSLRVLRLHECKLAFDLSCIGNLLNLEVLSFAESGTESGIKSLPSTIVKLNKLRVLDLTRCGGLRIDNGDFKNLVRLEELYAEVYEPYQQAITFTGDNCNEVAERWKNLSALAFHFDENNAQWKNLSFDKLERFKILVGRSLGGEDFTTSEQLSRNTLKLVTHKGEVPRSGINKLFEKTVVLWLGVDDMNDLEDIWVKPSLGPQSSSFGNLSVLVVSECLELRYLFTLGVAAVMSNLEQLHVDDCPVMTELIHIVTGGEEIVTFPKLKYLSLGGLPQLLGLCQSVNIIALPKLMELEIKGIPNITSIYSKDNPAKSCFLKEEVVIPKLETLHIEDMDELKEIWPCDFWTSEEVKLREIEVKDCKKLANLFPCNPMRLLHHLEELELSDCGSIEVLFNIDLDSVGQIGEEECNSNLKRIEVCKLEKLIEVWRIKGGEYNSHLPIRGFQAVESIKIRECESFRNVFTPTTTNFDMSALIDLNISVGREVGRKNKLVESNQEEEISILSMEETSQVGDSISCTLLFPTGLIPSFHKLCKLRLSRYQDVEVIFEIESTQRSQDNQQPLFPCLEKLDISDMERMSHVWKCNWNKLLILQKHASESPFHNLTTIYMSECDSIKYLFSPLMAKLLSNLKKVKIYKCDSMEEVVSHMDDKDEDKTTSISSHVITTLFPHLGSLSLIHLRNLKSYGGGNNDISFNNTITTTAFLDQHNFSQVDGVSWTLCQYPREINIWNCDAMSSVIPCYAAGQMQKLQVLKIESCQGMKEVFETQGINNKVIKVELTNLKELKIWNCDIMEHIFTLSTLETLGQLEELRIERCKAMKLIVKEEDDGEQTTKASSSKAPVVFLRLKSIELENLPELLGFFLGTNREFHWPTLDKFIIKDCPRMMVFTAGGSTATQLAYVETSLGKYSPPESWFNSHVSATTAGQHQESTSSSRFAATSQRINIWPSHNLIELDVKDNESVFERIVFPSYELQQLRKLEKINLNKCGYVEEVFELNRFGFYKSPTVVELPNLRQVYLERLRGLRYMWKSNRMTSFEFPNLTILSIQGCDELEHVFTSSVVGSLKQLQELSICYCNGIEVIVKDANVVAEEEEESDGQMNEIVLPRLKSLKLEWLKRFKGFCLGKDDFSFPLLDTLTITHCPKITTFTKQKSSTPKLKGIETGFGWFYVEEDVNSFIDMKQEEYKEDRWEWR